MKLPLFELPVATKREIFNQVAFEQAIPIQAVEKDWWVTLVMRAIFSSEHAQHLLFKGGTSLSKGWGLIKRFSEDIDLAVDKRRWGYDETISKSKIGKLREQSRTFVRTELADTIQRILVDWGAGNASFEIQTIDKYNEENKAIEDQDPTEIVVRYKSLFDEHQYLRAQVKIEVSARSMQEPTALCHIQSFVDTHYPDQEFALPSFEVRSVLPTRTFLEKAILLHEAFAKEFKPEKAERKSRHLYDLEQLMDTEHGQTATADEDLFSAIIAHRAKFTKEKGVDYDSLTRNTLTILPPADTLAFWEQDYASMTQSMIQGEALVFAQLLERLKELQQRFRITPKAD